MAKVQILLPKPILVHLSKDNKVELPAGIQEVDEELAKHWYVEHHSQPITKDDLALNDANKQLEAVNSEYAAAKEQLVEASTQIAAKDEKIAELEAKLAKLEAEPTEEAAKETTTKAK